VVLFSNSQSLKRRHLAHIARNCARKLIVVQVPAKIDEIGEHNFRQKKKKHTHTHTHRRLCSNSQVLKRRQLAHGARNRATQLIAVRVPAKIDETRQAHLPFRPNASTSPIVAHRIERDDSWPTVLGIVPVSRLLYKYLQARNQQQSLCSDTATTQTHHPSSPSDSQGHKRRQLAHGARNRATQLIEVQVPAKNQRKRQPHLSRSDQRKHITNRRLFSNSQFPKRRQLYHGARNRARQLIFAQVTANRR
jgi:hypothetical protein